MLNTIRAKIAGAYRSVVAHLTKALGGLGIALMSVDPQWIHDSASTYLGENPQRKIGVGLFALVMARGWYTGRKAAQAAAAKVPPPA